MGRRARAAGATLAAVVVGFMAALMVPAIGVAAGGETPIVVSVGNEAPVDFNFGISPTRLPASGPEATRLRVGFEENDYFDEGNFRGLKEVTLGLDHSIGLEPAGLPVCRIPSAEGIQVDSAGDKECSRAVVGRAEATMWIAYPENKAIGITSKGKVYNAGIRHGMTELWVELPPSSVVMDSTVLMLVTVKPTRKGPIGSEALISFPRIDSGYGYFTAFSFELGRSFVRQGERAGFVAAECSDHKLVATFAGTLTDGTESEEAESVRACSRAAVQH